MSIQVKFKWDQVKQKLFKEMKRIVVHNILLAYADFNKEFKIHTNS